MAEKLKRRSWSLSEKQRLVAEARLHRERGESWRSIAEKLNVNAWTLQRWTQIAVQARRCEAELRPVKLINDVNTESTASGMAPSVSPELHQKEQPSRLPSKSMTSAQANSDEAAAGTGDSTSRLTIMCPDGFRFEGIDLEAAVRLWRLLR